MVAPTDAAVDLQRLEDRTYGTYKARLKASERLAARGQAWNASMYAFSAALAVTAIGMLTDEDLYGQQGEAMLAGLSVLSLVASLVVGQLNYAVRSHKMEASYKAIQFISQDAEYVKLHDPTRDQFERLHNQYRELIRGGENHTSGDHWRGKGEARSHWSCWRESIVTAAPIASLVAPVLLLIPLIASLT